MENRPKWNVADAKAGLSKVIREAQKRPQTIESRGTEVAVVVCARDYHQLRAEADAANPASRCADFLRFSAELRAHGGATLKLPSRKPRRSPFANHADY